MHAAASMPLVDAQRVALGTCRELDDESIAAELAHGRISSGPVWARRPSPHYRASAMDGIAVRASDTAAALSSAIPTFAEVDTGQVIPEWADAVVRIEDTVAMDGGYGVRTAVVPGRDIRRRGEDIQEGALLFSGGHRLGAADIGAMLATGVTELRVVRRPRVALIATGSEIVEPDREPAPGEVVEFNSRMMAAMIEDWGGQPLRMPATDGSDQAVVEAIDGALADADLVCVIAGSSVGRKDSTIRLLADKGRLLFHGIRLMPGRPAALAELSGLPVLAIPGYPVSAALVCRELLHAMILRMLGGPAAGPEGPRKLRAVTRRKLPSKTGVEELLRVRLSCWGIDWVAVPLVRGAGSIGSLSRADALLRIEAAAQGVDAGTEVEVELLADTSYLEMGVTVAGRCPEPLVRLAETVRCGDPDMAGFHLGHLPMSDQDALRALEAGETHLAVVAGESAGHRLACADGDLRVLTLPAARELRLPGSLLALLEAAGG